MLQRICFLQRLNKFSRLKQQSVVVSSQFRYHHESGHEHQEGPEFSFAKKLRPIALGLGFFGSDKPPDDGRDDIFHADPFTMAFDDAFREMERMFHSGAGPWSDLPMRRSQDEAGSREDFQTFDLPSGGKLHVGKWSSQMHGKDGLRHQDRAIGLLFQAIVAGDLQSVENLLNGDEPLNLNTRRSSDGLNPLLLAISMGRFDIATILVKGGKAVSQPTDYSRVKELLTKHGSQESSDLLKVISRHEQDARAAAIEKKAERARKNPIEVKLRQAVIGQDSAIDLVAKSVRRRSLGWHDPDKPLVMMFLGSSGVGKTETAKQLAEYLTQLEDKGCTFVRVDMSEFQEKHEVSKLIGAPPGYVGFESGGVLTGALKKSPKAVVLLDEVEKAHPDVLTVLLQLFDEGRLTDGQGQTVSCPEAIFIMTSNLASNSIADKAEKNSDGDNFDTPAFRNYVINQILKPHFKRDEFLGRINEFVFFRPFDQSALITLARQLLTMWRDRISSVQGVAVSWDSPSVELALATHGYNARYGARSIKHEYERRIINKLALAHEKGVLKAGMSVRLEVKANPTSDDDYLSILIASADAPKKFSSLESLLKPKSGGLRSILGFSRSDEA